ncbi:MAG: YVTN family beta-propeller protein [Planctomycetota bacterium]|jgi:YVTN family beta-propeller protein
MQAKLLSTLIVATAAATTGHAQHAQVSSIAVSPINARNVWVCNRDNHTVSLVDTANSAVLAEVPVGINPRSLSLSDDGTLLFVANQRGNIPLSANAATGFPVNADPGTVTVINVGTRSVMTTLTQVAVEPYGVLVAPNGKYFAVTGFRSGTVSFYDASSFALLLTHQYMSDMAEVPASFTIADVDENRDGIADLGEPRGFSITGDSAKLFVTHHRSPFISTLDVTLDGGGLPTAVALGSKIALNEYTVDPFFNPVPVQTIASQGLPRFMEDIAISPDGTRALVPHVLHNINHDVNHDFGAGLAGDFANRVYPALTMIDAANESYNQGGDSSTRLHHELSSSLRPASYSSFGEAHVMTTTNNPLILGGSGNPTLGGSIDLKVEGVQPGDIVEMWIGAVERDDFLGSIGYRYLRPRFIVNAAGGVLSLGIPVNPSLDDLVYLAQAKVTDGVTGEQGTTNAVRILMSSDSYAAGDMGYRAGQPSRVLYSASGTSAIMLNRGSEDLFLYDVDDSSLTLRTVYPERIEFVERGALDDTTSMGDMPLGMAMIPDLTTDNDDALVYVANEGNRTVSSFRVDFTAGTILTMEPQVKSITGVDEFGLPERLGQELFEDASRDQTTGNFNNSCASCHFEGGGDGNVWQRPAGPRSTMPVYGGTLGTGLILWKGVRLNMGETGPMFGGENGGHGLLTDEEQDGLNKWHEVASPPLNPFREVGHVLSPTAALGRDLFFGANDTGLNPTLRTANCFECHDNVEENPLSNPGPRAFTVDFVNPLLSAGEELETLDPDCFSLKESAAILGIRNVNTGTDLDLDMDGFADIDRNGDGFDDRETYAIMNPDLNDDFRRDDPNGYLCPCDPIFDPTCDAMNPFQLFTRPETMYSIPTKMGVFSTGPYFHDHVIYSLRGLVDPESQMFDPVYGDVAYGLPDSRPGVFKNYNEVHDVRGHESAPGTPGDSKVQQTLSSIDKDADTEAILAFIKSL